MKRLIIALQFLTILPVKINPALLLPSALTRQQKGGVKSEIKETDYGKALLYFPFIGLLIGLILSLFCQLCKFLPNLVTSALILIISIIITGGIHLDGFADTCDGFYGSKPKEKILEIMRDSRIGVMGVIGIVCLLLLKFTLIVSIPQGILYKVLIMMMVFARWSQVLACYTSNYARREGKAKYFLEYARRKEFLVGSFFTFALFLLLMKSKGIILLVFSIVPVFLFINYVKRRIGGMTGDTIGATSEIAEIAVLFFGLIYLG